MDLDDVFNDAQPEPSAALFPGPSTVNSIEPFENALNGIARNSWSIIHDPHFDGPGVEETGSQPDSTTGMSVLDGVVDQIEKYLLKAIPIRTDSNRRVHLIGDGHAPICSARGQITDGLGAFIVEVDMLHIENHLSGFEA